MFGKMGGSPMPSPMAASLAATQGLPARAAMAPPPNPNSAAAAQAAMAPAMTDARYQMIMELVKAGMGSAADSGSPLAAFLAPLAGAMIGGKATTKLEQAKSNAGRDMAKGVFGDKADDPAMRGYLEVLNNPNAPDYLRSAAKQRLEQTMKGQGAVTRTGGGRSSRGGSGRLYGEYNVGGILHGRDSAGNLRPIMGPDGRPVSVDARMGRSGASGTPTGPASIEDELGKLMGDQPAAANPADPLGILNLPPA